MRSAQNIVAAGSYVYGNAVICHARVVCSLVRFGTGHVQDAAPIRDDVQEVTFYVCYGSPAERGVFSPFGRGYGSLAEAKAQATPLYGTSVRWSESKAKT